MAVVAALVLAQKLLPVKVGVDTPLALMIVWLGIWIVLAPLVGSRADRADVTPYRLAGQARLL